MKGFVGVTDNDWFAFLSQQPEIDEANFWQPHAGQPFRVLDLGEPFFFKLHSPSNYIAGVGFFAHYTTLPISIAWDTFREKNGAASLEEMRNLIDRFRRDLAAPIHDYQIGCILLEQPVFFGREDWIRAPEDFSQNIVRGKRYDLTTGIGKSLWDQVHLRIQARSIEFREREFLETRDRYGSPMAVIPRLGQGTFRIMVTDAYQRRCAVTQERTLPALEAIHIKPYSQSGPHRVDNGILLRSDIHRLFDTGYVTVTPNYQFEVSRRIREDFENGRDYYALNGRPLVLPSKKDFQPSPHFIEWHNENIFLG
jgi:putative restriction endonuclease